MGSITLYDAAQSQHPALLSTVQLAGAIHSVALAGDRILAAGETGVYILRMVTPQNLAIENFISLPADAIALAAAGNFGYAAAGESLFLFDIPSGAILDRRNYNGKAITDLSLAGDYVYLFGSGTLLKIEVTSYLPTPTAWLALQTEAETLHELYADGQFVYVPKAIEDDGTVLRPLGNQPPVDVPVRPLGNGELLKGKQGRAFVLYFGHVYTADSDTGTGISVTDPLTPNGAKIRPAVHLETNSGNDAATENTLVRITANVSAADAIRAVDFYLDGVKVATDGNFPFEYRFVAPDATAQPVVTLEACATDLDGNSSCSEPQTLQIAKDKTALRVLSVSPANGSHSVSGSIQQIEARFSHALDLSAASAAHVTLDRIDPRSGDTIGIVKAGVALEPAANKVLIVPAKPLPGGSYKATLSAAIASATGALLGRDYAWKFDTGAAVTWINPASGNWKVASNWSGGTVPQAGDNVTIATQGVTVTYNTGTLAINDLTVSAGSTLSMSNGTLGVDGTGTIGGTLALAAGTFNGSGTTTVSGQWNWTGGVLDTKLIVASTASALISPNNPNALPVLSNGATLTNQGTVDQNAGAYPLYIGGTVDNVSGASWNLQTDGAVTLQTGGAFNNFGSFVKTGGTSVTNWQVPITGSGTINITSGTMTLTGATTGAISGAITISANAAINYGQSGSTLATGGVAGSGTFTFIAANVTVSGTYNFSGLTQIESVPDTVTFTGKTSVVNLNLIDGTAAGTGAITLSGQFNWTGGVLSAKMTLAKTSTSLISPNDPNALPVLSNGATLTNQGTVDQNAGAYPLYIGGTIDNAGGATWDLQTDGGVDLQTGGAFNNLGSFVKTGGTSVTSWGVPITGSGTINITRGAITLTGATTGAISGAITISANAAINYGQSGSTLATGGVAGSGTFTFIAANVTVIGTYNFSGLTQIESVPDTVTFTGKTSVVNLNLIDGTAAGTGAITLSGQFNWTGGVLSAKMTLAKTSTSLISPNDPNALPVLSNGATLTNQGTVYQNAGAYPLYIGGTVDNVSGATWNLQTDGGVDLQTGGAFNNFGSFVKTGGTSVTSWGVPITGSGTINITSGTITLPGATTGAISGAITISANAAINYGQSGSTLSTGGVAGSGTFNFIAANVTVSGTYSFSGLTQIETVPDTVTFTGKTSVVNLNLIDGTAAGTGAITLSGQFNWTGGVLSANMVLAKTSTSLISPNDPNALPVLSNGATLTNQGTVDQNAGAYPLYIGGTVTNAGGATWNLQTDGAVTLQTGGAFNNSGSFKKTGGTSVTTWQVPITGSGSINISSGTLALSGSTSGSLTGKINIASGAAIDYGQAGSTLSSGGVTGSGTFTFTASATVTGAYSFSGQVQIEIGSGTLTFAGSIDFDNLNFSTGQLLGAGALTVSGNMDWSGGEVATTGTCTINSLTLSPTGSISIALGSSEISITDKITLGGSLSLSFGLSYDPAVGTVVPIFTFSGGFGGSFGGIFNLELGDGDPLSVDLSSGGLSVTVEAPPPGGIERKRAKRMANAQKTER